eukprot:5991205-Alexandrium_andersonii.AAC.1
MLAQLRCHHDVQMSVLYRDTCMCSFCLQVDDCDCYQSALGSNDAKSSRAHACAQVQQAR